MRGLFHLCLVSTTWLATGPGSSELPQVGICKAIVWSLEEGGTAISITEVLVAISTSNADLFVHFQAPSWVQCFYRMEGAQYYKYASEERCAFHDGRLIACYLVSRKRRKIYVIVSLSQSRAWGVVMIKGLKLVLGQEPVEG